MSGHGSPEFEKKLQEIAAKNADLLKPRRPHPKTWAEFTAPDPQPAEFPTEPDPHPIARPVHTIESPASPAMMVKTCRALKVLYGHGITWHDVGDRIVFFTPGDHCGCLTCNTYLHHMIEGTHPE